MANTVWHRGVTGTPGNQTALANTLFFDKKNGSPTGTGAIDDPLDDYDGSTIPANTLCVFADGVYTNFIEVSAQTNVTFVSNNFWGATLSAPGERLTLSSVIFFISGMIMSDYSNISPNLVEDCIFNKVGGTINNPTLTNCITVESRLRFTSPTAPTSNIRRCSIFGGQPASNNRAIQFLDSFNGTANFIDCHFSSDVTADVEDFGTGATINFNNCNQVPNNTATPALPFNEVGSRSISDNDCLFVGNPKNFEFQLQQASPLIGIGSNNRVLGGLNVGELVDLSSPVENNDITVGPPIVITDPATTGNIKPQLKTFSQIRKSPTVLINGLPNNTDNVPDNESTTLTPKRNTVNILYRETVGGADLTGEFIYGIPMYQDNSGNKTGEDDFNALDISSDGDIINNPDNLTSSNLIAVAQIQENFVLNDQ